MSNATGYGTAPTGEIDDFDVDLPYNPEDGGKYLCDFDRVEQVMMTLESGDRVPFRDENANGALKFNIVFRIAEGDPAGSELNRKVHYGKGIGKKRTELLWDLLNRISIGVPDGAGGFRIPRNPDEMMKCWPKVEDKDTGMMRKASIYDVIRAQFANGEQARVGCSVFTPSDKPNQHYYLIANDFAKPPWQIERLLPGTAIAGDDNAGQAPAVDDEIPF